MFKATNTDPRLIGRLISAISNAARIAGRDFGYVVWGIRDRDQAVVGTRFEPAAAQQFVSAGEVLDLLDGPSYFELLGKPLPESDEGILSGLQSDQLISSDVGGNWNIHNLGTILFAKDLNAFSASLARKTVRLVVYNGDGRMATVTHRKDFALGYASGFAAFNAHVNALVPAPEDGNSVIRKAHPLFPPAAVRELVANALIHQDTLLSH